METYIDLQILGTDASDDYVLSIPKEEFARLVKLDEQLVFRHWDGNKPVVLENYGEFAIKTHEDGSESNNLANLPKVNIVSG